MTVNYYHSGRRSSVGRGVPATDILLKGEGVEATAAKKSTVIPRPSFLKSSSHVASGALKHGRSATTIGGIGGHGLRTKSARASSTHASGSPSTSGLKSSPYGARAKSARSSGGGSDRHTNLKLGSGVPSIAAQKQRLSHRHVPRQQQQQEQQQHVHYTGRFGGSTCYNGNSATLPQHQQGDCDKLSIPEGVSGSNLSRIASAGTNHAMRKPADAVKSDQSSERSDAAHASTTGTAQNRGDANSQHENVPSTEVANRAPTRPMPARAPSTPSRNNVAIHVFDQHRKVRQDFQCDSQLLVRRMKYFRPHIDLRDSPMVDADGGFGKGLHHQPIEITVHCDVQIFSWLIRYIKATDSDGCCAPSSRSANGTKPPMTVANCFPILISSHFLKIDDLVDVCIGFVGANFVEVCKVTSDITALSEELLSRIAALVDIDAMEEVISSIVVGNSTNDAADEHASTCTESGTTGTPVQGLQRDAAEFEQLISRMYKLKIAFRFFQSRDHGDLHRDPGVSAPAGDRGEPAGERKGDIIWRCAVCAAPFSARHMSFLTCHKANLIVDYHGNAHCRHVPLVKVYSSWDGEQQQQQQQQLYDTGDYVAHLRTAGKDWRAIYWNLWGLIHHLKCIRCGEVFPMRNLSQCRYHSVAAHFQVGESKGRYLCCGRVANRFNYTSSMSSIPDAGSDRMSSRNIYTKGINVIPAGSGSHNFREDGCCTRNHVVRMSDIDVDEELRSSEPVPSSEEEAAADHLLETYNKFSTLIRDDGGAHVNVSGLDSNALPDEMQDRLLMQHGADLSRLGSTAVDSSHPREFRDFDDSESECDESEDGSYTSEQPYLQVPDSPPHDLFKGSTTKQRLMSTIPASKPRDKRARLARLDAMRDADEANLLLLSLSLRAQRAPLKPVTGQPMGLSPHQQRKTQPTHKNSRRQTPSKGARK